MNESREEKAPAHAELTFTHLVRQETVGRSTCQGSQVCPEAQVPGGAPCLVPGCPVPLSLDSACRAQQAHMCIVCSSPRPRLRPLFSCLLIFPGPRTYGSA